MSIKTFVVKLPGIKQFYVRYRAIFRRLEAQERKIRAQEERIQALQRQLGYRYNMGLPEAYYERALCEWWFQRTGKKLDLENPRTYNEKIQWLKLYDNSPLRARLADKVAVRDWVAEKLGGCNIWCRCWGFGNLRRTLILTPCPSSLS